MKPTTGQPWVCRRALDATSLHGVPYYDDAYQDDLQRMIEHFEKKLSHSARRVKRGKMSENVEGVRQNSSQDIPIRSVVPGQEISYTKDTKITKNCLEYKW